MNSLVSIVMCVYNGEKYLEAQLNSILKQTYKKFELLILDDNSTDGSWEILKKYQLSDERIKFIENENNLGFNKNFEKGILLSQGDFIAISDQDDEWLPDKIELLLKNIENNILIYSNSSLIKNGKETKNTLNSDIIHVDNPSYKSFLDGNFLTGHTCMFNKSLVSYITPFDENVFYYDWWIGFVAAYIGKIKYLDKILTKYRIHDDSIIQKFSSNADAKELRYLRKRKQLRLFGDATFLDPADKIFIQRFISVRENASKDIFNLFLCFCFLIKHHVELYPWYKKNTFKKLNFLRKQCLR